MRASSLEILAITALLVNYVAGDAMSQTTTETPIEISTSDSKADAFVSPLKAAVPSTKNTSAAAILDNWMSRMGSMQSDLINIQAVIVKDEDVNENCNSAKRKSNKRYLMCAGSILNRNHVLTSATCLHEATHIRHNIRAPLSVVIAPLKSSIQVISVSEYQVHPGHNTNPYSKQHLKHNVAILKLACRISMENFHKVELPRSPMAHTCSEENCIVAVYRRTGRTSNVMYQILAPNVPYLSRRRKETSVKDAELRRYSEYEKPEMIGSAIRLERPKRKLAEHPSFVGKHEFERRFHDVTSTSTSGFMTEDSTVEPTTAIPPEDKNLSSAAETSLYEDMFKALGGPVVGTETIRSLVVRSSEGFRSCAQTGAPIMLNRTQAAVVAIPCDYRQSSSKSWYSDLFENLDWLQTTLQEWNPLPGITQWPQGPDGLRPPGMGPSGNYSSCSTCIFNFFIEIGCKDKNQCGKNLTGLNGAHLPGQVHPTLETSGGGTRRKSPGCSGSTSIGIELGVGQGCEKTGKKSTNPIDARIAEIGKAKQQLLPSNGAGDDAAQVDQPVADRPVKTVVRDYITDKEKYSSKDNSRVPRVSKVPMRGSSNRERVTNEIGLRNIEGDPADWLAEVEKGLELSSEVKRELVKSRRSSIK